MHPLGRADQRLHQLDRRRVEVGVGLVEQKQLRVVQRRARHGHALDHPARERPTGSSALLVIETASQLLLDALLVDTVQARVVAQVLARGQLAVQQWLVAEQADPPAYLPSVVGQAACRAP